MDYNILPGEGLSDLRFGSFPDEVIERLGEPGDCEKADEDLATEMWLYPDKQLTLFMEGSEPALLICIESEHPETTLFGKKIFELDEKQIIDLLKANNGGETDIEDEAWGERRVSFDDLMIDFYFEKGKLRTVNFSMMDEEED